jgi:hypothetical protein
MHTLTHQAAEGLTVLDVAPSREQIDQRVAQVAKGGYPLKAGHHTLSTT